MPFWVEALVAALLLGPSTTIAYQLIAARAAAVHAPAPVWMVTPLDTLLPVVPAAIWVYVSWYPAMLLLALNGREAVRTGFVAVALAFAACALGHVLLPVGIERPRVDPHAGLSASVLTRFYELDPPYNLFPSFHAAGAAILVALRPRRAVWSWLVPPWAVALCAACVLVRQHFVLDVVAGLGVGALAARAARRALRRIESRPAAGERLPPSRSAGLALVGTVEQAAGAANTPRRINDPNACSGARRRRRRAGRTGTRNGGVLLRL